MAPTTLFQSAPVRGLFRALYRVSAVIGGAREAWAESSELADSVQAYADRAPVEERLDAAAQARLDAALARRGAAMQQLADAYKARDAATALNAEVERLRSKVQPHLSHALSGWPYVDGPENFGNFSAERLIRAAVQHAGSGSARRRARWAHVRDLFAVGKTSAHELCNRFGVDPDEIVGDREEQG